MNGVVRWAIGQRRQSRLSSTDMRNSAPCRSKKHMSHGLSLNQKKPLIGRGGRFLSLCQCSHTCGRRSMMMTQSIWYVMSTSVCNAHVPSRLWKVYSCTSVFSICLHSFSKPCVMFQVISALEGTLGLLCP